MKRGETLLAIARKLRVSKADLAEANYLKATARVAAGQKLMVPHEATVLMAARTDRPAPATEARTHGRRVGRAGQRRDLEPRQDELPGEAGRHARVDRPAVQDDRGVAQDAGIRGSPARQPAAGQRLTVYRLDELDDRLVWGSGR